MIYAITTGDNVVALTDNKNNLDRVRADPDYSCAEIRWATPTEAARFRTLLAAEQRKRWPVLRWLAWLWPPPAGLPLGWLACEQTHSHTLQTTTRGSRAWWLACLLCAGFAWLVLTTSQLRDNKQSPTINNLTHHG